MTKHTFSVEPRTIVGRSTKQLRNAGTVPANIFGKDIPSKSVQLSAKNFQKLIREVGESSLLYLQLSGTKDELPVLIRDLDYHPVTGLLQHVSFQQVSLKEKTSATIPLVLSGKAPAEEAGAGIMVQSLDEVEVEALPTDIPENFTLDVSSLVEVGSNITIADLKLDPSKFTLITDPSTIIVQISPLAKEEAAPAAPEGEAPTTAPEGETPAPTAAPAPES